MPMLLRSRKSIHPGSGAEDTEAELPDTTPATTRRRSTRLPGRTTYEESDHSETESVRSLAMESVLSPPPEEEEAAEEEDVTENLKGCSVVLNRLQEDEKAEEKEDMNRKGGKLVSRIPTYHKRPPGASQTSELPVLKKETPVHAAPPHEKAGLESVEASKSKPLDVRETALPLPSFRVPKFGLEAHSPFTSAEQVAATAHSSSITTPKSWGLSGVIQNPLLIASPRPAIRPEQGSEQHLPEEDNSKTSEVEFDNPPDVPVSQLLHQGSLSTKSQDDPAEEYYVEVKEGITVTASEDTTTSEYAESALTAEVGQVDDIMSEEAPWEKEPMNTLDSKDSRSSSDAETEEDLTHEKSELDSLEEVKEHPEPQIVQSEFSKLEKKMAEMDESTSEAKVSSTKSTKSSGCSSFILFFCLPTTLLLLGGFGQHVWHYGLPMSMAHLTAQLELHWLEGFGLVPEPCSTDCRVHLVESIPEGLYQSSPSSRRSIADSWMHLLHRSSSSVHIAAFYFTLLGSDLEFAGSSDSQGRRVFDHLKRLQSKGVKLQIAVNGPQTSTQETSELTATGAEVREVDLKAVTGGIVHTKLWVVDQKHFYLGSANMDWRSLSEVKEVGLLVEDCSCLAQDAFRIFGVYWNIGAVHNGSQPPYWPARLSALSSSQNPLHLKFNGVPAQVYLSSSPPQISARGRSDDLDTILSVIGDAQKFVYISVMDYLPLSQFTEPIRYWPAIDIALRGAACTRGVQVRLLVSCWEHSPASMFTFLQSLLVLNRPPLKCAIDIKIFTVPSTAEQKTIPFARVNHAKFMVTDRVVYIGTSNWSENYFTHTAGVGLVVNQTGSVVGKAQQTLQSQAEELFLRDWRSPYASTLSVDSVEVCPHGRH
ncbi:5'-3' exonuclease PLD3 isoform X1 [Hippoglossus hippoglossus]|uniref:5'-3' exonuclease PLD3 isoform X1 n=1 Tax=Hippoglossus hippoglossus TaxID=8267 RepID=UPI00148D996E|nr:5'-3' exonuclease PLD3 isoform X1 [Hippoglossus hippoglossus]